MSSYTVRTDLPVALAAQRDVDLGSLLDVLLPASASSARRGEITPASTA